MAIPVTIKRSDYYHKFFGRPRAFYSAQEMLDKGIEYFRSWENMRRPVTIGGLCLYLKIDERTFNNYANGKYDHIDDFSTAANKMKAYICMDKTEKALMGIYHPGFTQYNLTREYNKTAKAVVKITSHTTDSDKSMERETLILELERRGIPTDSFRRSIRH